MRPTNSGSDTAGGARAFMQPTLGENFAPRFQSVTDSLATRREDFKQLWGAAMQKLLPYAQTEQERQTLYDAERGRMSFNAFELILTIAAREPIPYTLQGATERAVFDRIRVAPTLCVHEASENEQRANEPLNIAQLLAAKEKTPVRYRQVAELCDPQIFATITLREAAWAKSRDGAR